MKVEKTRFFKTNLKVVIAASFTMIAIIGMLAIGVIFYSTYTNSTRQQTVEDNMQLVSQVELNLTNYLRNMMRISDSLYYNVIKDTDFADETIDKELTLLYEANRDHLVSIACFDAGGKLVVATPVNTIKEQAVVTEQNWFIEAKMKPENLHFSSSHVQDLFVDSNDHYYWVISLSRGVELTKAGNAFAGILLVDMNFSGIEHLFAKVNSSDISYMYLMDQNGEIIYHPQQNLIYSELSEESNKTVVEYEDGIHSETFHGQDRIVVVKTVGYTGWKIVSVIPNDNLYQNRNRINLVWLTVLAVSIIMLIFVNQYLSTKITMPIRNLEKSVKQLELQYPEKIYVGGSEEIQHLGKTIRSMVEQMRKLMDDVVREQEEKRKNELDALQSQINPHFLYNTLDSIIWMAEGKKNEEVVLMTASLARLLRQSISNEDEVVSIWQETEYVKSYLTIQKMRYKDKLEFEIHVDPSIRYVNIIKLVLQPLVENAIYHGLKYKESKGMLQVRGYESGENAVIEIIDNGVGMSKETLDHIFEKHKVNYHSNGVGVYNVQQRLQLYYGKDYGITYQSEPGIGTTVTIVIPKKQEGSHEDF